MKTGEGSWGWRKPECVLGAKELLGALEVFKQVSDLA